LAGLTSSFLYRLEEEADKGQLVAILNLCNSEEDSSDNEKLVRVATCQPDDKWDCESILSKSYTNELIIDLSNILLANKLFVNGILFNSF
jgi:hypothetical protein